MLVSPGWCACSLVLSVSLSLSWALCATAMFTCVHNGCEFSWAHTHTPKHAGRIDSQSLALALCRSLLLSGIRKLHPCHRRRQQQQQHPKKGPPRANMLMLRAGFCTFYCRAVHARAHEVSAHAQVYRNRAALCARKHGKDGRKLAKRRLARACLWTFNLGPEIINDTSLDEA